jgi:hypothetical protein
VAWLASEVKPHGATVRPLVAKTGTIPAPQASADVEGTSGYDLGFLDIDGSIALAGSMNGVVRLTRRIWRIPTSETGG